MDLRNLDKIESLGASQISRRRFLGMGVAVTATLAATSLLAACGDDDDEPDAPATGDPTPSDDDEDEDVGADDDAEETPDDADDADDAPDDARQGGVVVFGMSSNPDTLDQHVGSNRNNEMVNANIYDRMLEYDADGEYIAGLVEQWESTEDALTWTLTLKQGVTFHDGSDFDASVVQFTFDRIANPETNSQKAVGLLGPYDGSNVIDDYTIEVNLSEIHAGFVDSLASFYLVPQSPAAIEEWGLDYGQNPVGTGPFMFKEWIPRDHLTLVRNPDYNWAPASMDHQGPPYLEEVEFKFIPEAATRVTTLETGETDMINNLPLQDYDRIEADDAYEILMAPVLGQPPSMIVNTEKFPTDDILVRKAIQHAINQQEIIDVIFYGVYEQAYGPLTQYNRYYNSAIEGYYDFNPDQAIEYLEEAGWEEGSDGIRVKDGERLELVYLTFPGGAGLPELIQAQLRAVGADISILSLDNPANLSAAQAGDHNLRWLNWLFSDAGELNTTFHSENIGTGWNFCRWRDPELDSLLDEGRNTVDDSEREQIYHQIQELVLENALIVPMYVGTQVVGSRAGLQGLKIHQLGDTPLLYDAYLDD